MNQEVQRYLNFSLGSEEFAIPLLSVREVIGVPDLTPVPHTPPYFSGMMNLRGSVISVIDLRKKLGLKSHKEGETSVIILDLKPHALGIIVDGVNSVIAPKPDEIQPRPSIESKTVDPEYITGVWTGREKLVLLLDITRLLSAADKKAIDQTTRAA